jgi:phosphatidylinositol alpha-mannosyltransferase
MKVALVSAYEFPYPGGVTEHTAALATGLRQKGCEVHILAACSGYQGLTFPDLKVITRTVTRVPIGGTVARVGLSPLAYLRIRKILQQEKFDVIHLQEPLTPSVTWWALLQAQTWPHTVTIGTFHAHHERPNWFFVQGQPIFAKLFARLDALIAVSEAARGFAAERFPGRYRLIPNGIDLKRFGKIPLPPSSNPTALNILFVGRLNWRKGFHKLLDSFIRLKRDYPHLRLTVVGPFDPTDCAPYLNLARRHNLSGLEFIGYVPPDQLPAYYHQADIFCAPAVGFESFGIILLEAMAAGLPVVASEIAGYRSVLTDSQEGFLVPPDSAVALDNALCQLLDNSWLRYKMGSKGRQTAQAYNWEGIVDQTLTFYYETIEQKRKATKKLALLPMNGERKPFSPPTRSTLSRPVEKI